MTPINVPWRAGRGVAYEQALIDEIVALRAAVLSLGEFVMEIDRNPCDHVWEYLSDPAEIAAAKRAENEHG